LWLLKRDSAIIARVIKDIKSQWRAGPDEVIRYTARKRYYTTQYGLIFLEIHIPRRVYDPVENMRKYSLIQER
jgi:cell division protein FtsB